MSKFNNSLEADAHNWDTREISKENKPTLREQMTLLSDKCYSQELSTCPLHPIFQPQKFINLIINLLKEELEGLEPYIKQVVDCDNFKEGYALIDPVGLVALDYWFKELKEKMG